VLGIYPHSFYFPLVCFAGNSTKGSPLCTVLTTGTDLFSYLNMLSGKLGFTH